MSMRQGLCKSKRFVNVLRARFPALSALTDKGSSCHNTSDTIDSMSGIILMHRKGAL